MGRRARKGKSAAIEGEITVRPRALGGRAVLRAALGLLLAAASLPPPSLAQTPTGDIQGIVTEQAAGVLSGVSITVTDVNTGAVHRSRTGREGRFAVLGLPPGLYDVVAEQEGYASQRQERVQLGVGQTVVSRLELRRAALPETLTLAPAPLNLESRHSEGSSRLERTSLEHLPLARRNPLDLARIVPGVSSGAGDGEARAAGVADIHNAVLLDGVDLTGGAYERATDTGIAQPPYRLNPSWILDARVVLGAPGAEYGRAGGAITTIATRPGSDLFSGAVAHILRDTALAANTLRRSAQNLAPPDLESTQWGAFAGGPIASGHAFFAAWDRLRGREENPVSPRLAGAPSLPAPVAARLAPLAGDWTSTIEQDLLMARTDHQWGSSGRLSLRYQQGRVDGSGLAARGPQRSYEASGPAALDSHLFSTTVAGRLGPSRLNEVRVLSLRDTYATGANARTPLVDIRDLGTLVLQAGRHAQAPDDWRLRRIQLANTFMWSGQRHSIKAGGDLQLDDVRHRSGAGANGAYLFGSPDAFLPGVPATHGDWYAQVFYEDGRDSFTTRPAVSRRALFVQDSWLLHEKLTVDAGLRYDLEVPARRVSRFHPELLAAGIDARLIDADRNNWGPRLGLAWLPSPRLLARGAHGVLYGRMRPDLLSAAHRYNGVDVRPVTLSAAAGDALPSHPDRLAGAPATARPDLVHLAKNFELPTFAQTSAGIEWAWLPTTTVGVTYMHTRGASIPRAVDINVGEPNPAPLRVEGEDTLLIVERFGAGPLAGFGRVIRIESTASSRYHGLALELRRRYAQGVSYLLAYTLGTAADTASSPGITFPGGLYDGATMPVSPADAETFAAADHDRRHRLVATAVATSDAIANRTNGVLEDVFRNWQVGVLYSLESGRPYSARVYGDPGGDRNPWNDLAPQTERNAFRTPGMGRLDVRFARDFPLGAVRLTAYADIFNAFNAAHYRSVETTRYGWDGRTLIPNPTFGERFDQAMPRLVQLGLALRF